MRTVPSPQLGRGQRTEIGPEQPLFRLHDISGDLHTSLEPPRWVDFLFERLFNASPMHVVAPAVIVAAQTCVLDVAIGEISAAMRAMPIEQSIPTTPIAIQHQILAE